MQGRMFLTASSSVRLLRLVGEVKRYGARASRLEVWESDSHLESSLRLQLMNAL